MQRSAPSSTPFSGALSVFLPPLLCASFHFIVYCSVFFFLRGWGGNLPRGYAGLSQGWLREYHMMLGTHLFGLQNVSQTDLEPAVAVAVAAAHLFSQCNVAWRSFLQARGSGCWRFDSPWCFISAKCARFLSHRVHTFWFCTLVTILDLLPDWI
jgi:hypothetical protein